MPPFSGGSRAENIEMMPRVPSISCRSRDQVRAAWINGSRSSSVLPSTTTSTSYSLDGKRRVTDSYCLNSGVSERNSWLSELSTWMRQAPNAAAMQSAIRTRVTASGKRSDISPIRSIPSAMRWCSAWGVAGVCRRPWSRPRSSLSEGIHVPALRGPSARGAFLARGVKCFCRLPGAPIFRGSAPSGSASPARTAGRRRG